MCRILLYKQGSRHCESDREQHKEDVLYDIATTSRRNAHRSSPWRPVLALCVVIVTPAAELAVQVELTATVTGLTVALLDVSQPVRGDVDACCDEANHDTSSNEDHPDVAGIGELFEGCSETMTT